MFKGRTEQINWIDSRPSSIEQTVNQYWTIVPQHCIVPDDRNEITYCKLLSTLGRNFRHVTAPIYVNNMYSTGVVTNICHGNDHSLNFKSSVTQKNI